LRGQQLRQGIDATHAGQVVVQQHHIGLVLGHVAQGLAGVGGFGHHRHTFVTGEQGGQAASKEGVVIDHEQANGHAESACRLMQGKSLSRTARLRCAQPDE